MVNDINRTDTCDMNIIEHNGRSVTYSQYFFTKLRLKPDEQNKIPLVAKGKGYIITDQNPIFKADDLDKNQRVFYHVYAQEDVEIELVSLHLYNLSKE